MVQERASSAPRRQLLFLASNLPHYKEASSPPQLVWVPYTGVTSIPS